MTNDGAEQPDEDEYYVEKIVGRRHTQFENGERGLQYKVRFRGEGKDEDRWYDAEQLPNLADTIRVYDTVIRPLNMCEQATMEGFLERRAADGIALPAPVRPPRPPSVPPWRRAHPPAAPAPYPPRAPVRST